MVPDSQEKQTTLVAVGKPSTKKGIGFFVRFSAALHFFGSLCHERPKINFPAPPARLSVRLGCVRMSAVNEVSPEEGIPADSGQSLPALRNDLVFSRQSYRGRTTWVVKDPASGKFHRIGEREHALAMLLDGRRTADEVYAILIKRFPADRLEKPHLMQMLQGLLQMGFLKLRGDFAQRFYSERLKHHRQARLRSFGRSLFASVVFFRVSFYDPDKVLIRLSRFFRIFWTRAALVPFFALLALAVYLFLQNIDRIPHTFESLFSLQNLIYLWLTLVLVKVVHEFGHGLACKHFGGEVHDMGALFIVFTPFFYCNATDSWRFPDKWQKLAVNFAGIYFELIVASLATIAWSLVDGGLAAQLLFNLMLLCSVSTLFFNLNPLMRFDGYYALADYAEVPNLKATSGKVVMNRVISWLTGERMANPGRYTARECFWIGFYGVASYLWLFMIFYSLVRLAGYRLQPLGLDRPAQIMASLVLGTAIVLPVVKLSKGLREFLRERPETEAKKKVAIRVGLVLALLTGLWFFPVNLKVSGSCVLEDSETYRVKSQASGFIREVRVREGMTVHAGDTLLQLENEELKWQRDDLAAQLDIARINLRLAVMDGHAHDYAALRNEVRKLEEKIAENSRKIDALTLVAPADGYVATPDLQNLLGLYLEEGIEVMSILPLGEREVILGLQESRAGRVEAGQSAYFRLYALSNIRFEGEVTRTFEQRARRLPHPALAAGRGGDVATGRDAGGTEVAIDNLYLAEIRLYDDHNLLKPGMSGRATILCGRTTLGNLLVLRVRELLRDDFRL